jgi:alkylation response protein AidB-like acyl-CoA dehydrogenase
VEQTDQTQARVLCRVRCDVDLSYPPEAEEFRAEVQRFLGEHLPAGFRFGDLDRDAALEWTDGWRRTMAAKGMVGVSWPTEYGGRGLPKIAQVVLAEEFAKAGVPWGRNIDVSTLKMMGNTLLRWGSEEQKRRFLPGILSGDENWVQGYSEPDAGSDLAALTLQARLDGDEWVLNGQKIWTSRGELGDWIFVLARTDPSAAKHRGITFLLVPMHQPGVQVRPIVTSTGQPEFCEVWLTDARTDRGNVLGEVNGGWAVANSLLGLERGEEAATNPILFAGEFDRLVDLARTHGRDGDPVIRQRLAWCYTKVQIMRFLGYRTLTAWLGGGDVGPESSIAKLYWSEYHQVATDLALETMGAGGLVHDGRRLSRQMRTDEVGAPNSPNAWIDIFLLNARSGTVYAGTSEIQRNILAERVLGLPKGP